MNLIVVAILIALVDAQFDELLDDDYDDVDGEDMGVDPLTTLDLCYNETITEQDVIELMFSKMNPASRPTFTTMEITEIYISAVLFGIVDFDEKNNQLTVFGDVSLTWSSLVYSWEYSFPEHCIYQVMVPASTLWIPSFEVWNTPDGEQQFFKLENKRAVVSYQGYVAIKYKGSIVTKCQVDLSHYPFDDQLCMITLISQYYNNNTVLVSWTNENETSIKSDDIWVEHSMWKLVNSTKFIRKVSEDNELQAHMVRFKLHLRRDPTYHILNIIVPSLMIGAVTLIVFTMPVGETARIEIAFTCLLAYTFFQTLVLQDMPRSSLSIPIITIFIQLQMAYIAVLAILPDVMIQVIIERFVTKKRAPPPWLLKLCKRAGIVMLVPYVGNMAEDDQEDGFHSLTDDNRNESPPQGLEEASSCMQVPKLRKKPTPQYRKTRRAKYLHRILHSHVICPVMPAKFWNIPDDIDDMQRDAENIREQWDFILVILQRIRLTLYVSAFIATPVVLFYAMPKKKTFDDHLFDSFDYIGPDVYVQ